LGALHGGVGLAEALFEPIDARVHHANLLADELLRGAAAQPEAGNGNDQGRCKLG